MFLRPILPNLIRIFLRPMLPKLDNTNVSKANVAKFDTHIPEADAAKMDNTNISEVDTAKTASTHIMTS